MASVGISLEENIPEFLRAFQVQLRRELGRERSALENFAPRFLADLARAFRQERLAEQPWRRAVLLIAAKPEGGTPGLVREFALLRQCVWETLACRRHAIASRDRRFIDRAIDEALAEAVERNGRLEFISWRAGTGPSPERAPMSGGRRPPSSPFTASRDLSPTPRRTPPPLPKR